MGRKVVSDPTGMYTAVGVNCIQAKYDQRYGHIR